MKHVKVVNGKKNFKYSNESFYPHLQKVSQTIDVKGFNPLSESAYQIISAVHLNAFKIKGINAHHCCS